ncbi:unnamed protein product [Spirodela intermedia]|uniref:Uncharacterized protein n=2 Tax=Spirodela intermedia TaxID=51605 RepID=A0A7I8IHR9_SPIIN|nr:unnamed protein product [Spirodela intermedia]CAA6657266.1 unnamed protein product [Spirodela intermedia]CAA7393308.1 unnamed protein product [Spirodela intermedia]
MVPLLFLVPHILHQVYKIINFAFSLLEQGRSPIPVATISTSISSTVDIVEAQSKYGFWGWNLWRQPIVFIVFLISSLAECERLPFDSPEAEEELVAGYQTEYSGIKYGCFMSLLT